jgi:hypothetical protein
MAGTPGPHREDAMSDEDEVLDSKGTLHVSVVMWGSSGTWAFRLPSERPLEFIRLLPFREAALDEIVSDLEGGERAGSVATETLDDFEKEYGGWSLEWEVTGLD